MSRILIPSKAKPVLGEITNPKKSVTDVQEGAVWVVPKEGWVKLNMDGSFLAENDTAGTGMILQDHTGDIIFSLCRCLHYCYDDLDAELMAIKEGLSLAL